jgi:hypothetical protein
MTTLNMACERSRYQRRATQLVGNRGTVIDRIKLGKSRPGNPGKLSEYCYLADPHGGADYGTPSIDLGVGYFCAWFRLPSGMHGIIS